MLNRSDFINSCEATILNISIFSTSSVILLLLQIFIANANREKQI